MSPIFRFLPMGLCCALLAACGIAPIKPSQGHIRAEAPRPGVIPPPITQVAPVPVPKPAPKQETYSVSVVNVPVQELLFALARDAKLNVDIHPGIQGTVTLNAIDQTLPQILSRLSRQVDMRYEVHGQTLEVMPDTPFLRNYKVDYVNMTRETKGVVDISTQIATTGGGAATAGAAAAGAGNTSTTKVTDEAKNRFWDTLIANIKDILRETDKVLPEGSSETVVQQASSQTTTGTGAPTPATRGRSAAQPSIAASPNPATLEGTGSTVIRRTTFREAASVIANPETGILSIRATARQHEKIQQFLDQVMAAARRQVMIEATVVEVQLNNQYQQGINWSRFGAQGRAAGGFSLEQAPVGTIPSGVNAGIFVLNYANNTVLGNLSAVIQLLESFGTVKVLSSPRLSVLNNQTALLKVVDNRVYFTVEATQSTVTGGGTIIPGTVTAKPNTVSVGFVMSVTPQISETDTVLLNVRPTVSRITDFVTDPTPALAAAGVVNRVPEIQTREMESVIKVESGQVAVMGGLMQDTVNNVRDSVPGIGSLPLVGNLFSHRNESSTKSELVIFLRPIVIKNASLSGDFASLRGLLPDDKFFAQPAQDEPAAARESR